MPLLARMLLSPLFIDIRAGAVSGLGDCCPTGASPRTGTWP